MDTEKFLQLARENGATHREAATFCLIVAEAIEEEREACAKVCEELDTYEPEIRQEYADAIRMRSNV